MCDFLLVITSKQSPILLGPDYCHFLKRHVLKSRLSADENGVFLRFLELWLQRFLWAVVAHLVEPVLSGAGEHCQCCRTCGCYWFSTKGLKLFNTGRHTFFFSGFHCDSHFPSVYSSNSVVYILSYSVLTGPHWWQCWRVNTNNSVPFSQRWCSVCQVFILNPSLPLLDPAVKAAQDFFWWNCQCCDQHFLGSAEDTFAEMWDVHNNALSSSLLFLQGLSATGIDRYR